MRKINAILPSAPVREIKVGKTTYVGANPQYSYVQPDPLSPGSWVKTHKGVPYRRV